MLVMESDFQDEVIKDSVTSALLFLGSLSPEKASYHAVNLEGYSSWGRKESDMLSD